MVVLLNLTTKTLKWKVPFQLPNIDWKLVLRILNVIFLLKTEYSRWILKYELKATIVNFPLIILL